MKWATYFRRALRSPPHVVLREGSRIIARETRDAARRRRDRRRPTFDPRGPGPRIALRLGGIDMTPLDNPDLLRTLAAKTLRHEFELLGSGWVHVHYGMRARGIEGHVFPATGPVAADADGAWLEDHVNPANLKVARRIWSMVDDAYIPIDWQLDFISGYRWDPQAPSSTLGPAPASGADIKVPWEISRMQHLVWLAEAYAAEDADKDALAGEFRNQVLDFIATNPPRYGANWTTPMDIGIRAVNWLIAFDLFRAQGHRFDIGFEDILGHAIVSHAAHIVAHLEWSPGHRGNHYLSNVACLGIIASYLPSTPRHDAWLALALQELRKEITYQFHPDGSNFEASTCYHRLSTEFVVYAVAALLGVDDARWSAVADTRPGALKSTPRLAGDLDAHPDHLLSDTHWRRLERAAEFTVDLLRPDGRVPQVGDNDNGRLIKAVPTFRPDGLEDHLDHRGIVAAVAGLIERPDLVAAVGPARFEQELVRCLSGCPPRTPARTDGTHAHTVRIDARTLEGDVGPHRNEQDLGPAFEGPITAVYPDFGLVIHKTPSDYFLFRCGTIGQGGNGGHAHNDQLSIEYWRDGVPLAMDPGTYVYTSLPARRNDYRSVHAHHAPSVNGEEPSSLSAGTFHLPNPRPKLLQAGPEGCAGVHHGYGVPLQRFVRFRPTLRIIDRCEKPLDSQIPVDASAPCRICHSPGYGFLDD